MGHNIGNFVFLQCYTHNNLGWKIHVVNSAHTAVLSMVTTTFVVSMLKFIRWINLQISFGGEYAGTCARIKLKQKMEKDRKSREENKIRVK